MALVVGDEVSQQKKLVYRAVYQKKSWRRS